MGELLKFLPRQTVGVCAGYKEGRIVAAVALVTLAGDDVLGLSFPKKNPFRAGEAVTVHLDDRVGAEIYTIELRVHRASYKGTVAAAGPREATVVPVAYELFYGSRVAARYSAPGYAHPAAPRPEVPFLPSPLAGATLADRGERENKLGVLVTRGPDRPHTTVMAFLNSDQDDIFLITMRETYKYHNLVRNPDCVFALDHRGSFSFEHQVDWNYTLYEAQARLVAPGRPEFQQIQGEFVDKNPWETAFFTNPSVVMVHLVPRRIIHQDILCD
jgi:nitroimidazol reductase NimA-like FMN-containing flavoprotein (pyridoxamine 5'-phosphate oxidase superfamily)